MGRTRLLLVGLLLSALASCGLFGSKKPPPVEAPAPLDITLVAGSLLNPDDGGQSLPTVVRIYQLKSIGKFEAAEYEQIYRQPKETLGEALLQADEVVLSAGETVRRRLDREQSAQAVAVVSMVRHPAGLSWRSLVELQAGKERPAFTFYLEGYRVERR